jgi:DNA polymerase-3 subunit epsilon
MTRPIAFFDLETTGTNPDTAKIVEIGIVKLMPSGERVVYHQLVNPGCKIPKDASDVHHITDEMVADKPKFADIADDVLNFLLGSDYGGYNHIAYDISVLICEFARLKIDFSIAGVKLYDAYKVFKKTEPHTLSKAVEFYCGRDIEDAHSAVGDVNSTIDVLLSQMQKYKLSFDQIDDLCTDGLFDLKGVFKLNSDNEPVFTLGKHKDRLLNDILRTDYQYIKWFMSADFPYETKLKINEYITKLNKARS